METSFVRCLPAMYFIWTLFAAVALTKMAPLVEHAPDSAALARNSTSTLFEGAIAKLAMTCHGGYATQALPFLHAFQRLNAICSHRKNICLTAKGRPGTQAGQMEGLLGTTVSVRPPNAHSTLTAMQPEIGGLSADAQVHISQTVLPSSPEYRSTTPTRNDEPHNVLSAHSQNADFPAPDDPLSGMSEWLDLPLEDELLSDDAFPKWLFK